MHYVGLVAGEERQIEVVEASPDHYVVFIDGRRLEIDARHLASHSMSLLIGDAAHAVELEREENAVTLAGQRVGVEILDLRRMRLRRAQETADGPDGPAKVVAPMPGKVVAVLVKEGQEVALNQGLVVVEAMKMENELRAPKAGVVRQLVAQVGSAVESGAALCVIE